MLRYADAIVKRGVDKLIDAIAHSEESQTKNTETPQPQKSMGNDTDCAPQTTENTVNCGLTEQAIALMDERYVIRYNVLDRTPEVQRHDPADKGLVSVSEPYLRPLKNAGRVAPISACAFYQLHHFFVPLNGACRKSASCAICLGDALTRPGRGYFCVCYALHHSVQTHISGKTIGHELSRFAAGTQQQRLQTNNT